MESEASSTISMKNPYYYENAAIEKARRNIKDREVTKYTKDEHDVEMDKLRNLVKWTTVCITIHILWTITAVGLYLGFDSFRDYGADITYTKSSRFTFETKPVFNFNITLAAGLFTTLSAVFHIFNIGNEYEYYKQLNSPDRTNVYRWIEYSLSASLMAVIVAVICRVTDISIIILIFAVNALTMTVGIPLELLRKNKYYTIILIMTWVYFLIGSSVLFITLFTYTDSVPAIAWASIFTINTLFQSFGFWQLTINSYDVYDYELGYCVLSVIAKSALFILVIWGGSTDSKWMRELYKCNFDTIYTIMS